MYSAEGILSVLMDRQHNHAYLGIVLHYMVQDLKATTLGHRNVEQHQVWLEFCDEFQRFLAAAGFSDDDYVFDLFHERTNASAHERVVVSNKHANRIHSIVRLCFFQTDLIRLS